MGALAGYSHVLFICLGATLLLALWPAILAHRKGRNAIGWYLYGVVLLVPALLHAWMLPDELAEEDRWKKTKKIRACLFGEGVQPMEHVKVRADWAFLPAVIAVVLVVAVPIAFYVANGKMVTETRDSYRLVLNSFTDYALAAFWLGVAWLLPGKSKTRLPMLASGVLMAINSILPWIYTPNPNRLGNEEFVRLDFVTGTVAVLLALAVIWMMLTYVVGKKAKWPIWMGAILMIAGVLWRLFGFELVLAVVRATNKVVTVPVGFIRVAARAYKRDLPYGVLAMAVGWFMLLGIQYPGMFPWIGQKLRALVTRKEKNEGKEEKA
nr:hypothetical protein [bacterium]